MLFAVWLDLDGDGGDHAVAGHVEPFRAGAALAVGVLKLKL